MQDIKKTLQENTTRPQNAQGIINETYFLLLFLFDFNVHVLGFQRIIFRILMLKKCSMIFEEKTYIYDDDTSMCGIIAFLFL